VTWRTVSFWTENLIEVPIWSFPKTEILSVMQIETQVPKNKVFKTQILIRYLTIIKNRVPCQYRRPQEDTRRNSNISPQIYLATFPFVRLPHRLFFFFLFAFFNFINTLSFGISWIYHLKKHETRKCNAAVKGKENRKFQVQRSRKTGALLQSYLTFIQSFYPLVSQLIMLTEVQISMPYLFWKEILFNLS
jgi:hypothetical protein